MEKIKINNALCKGCALCIDVCPKDVIKINTGVLNNKGYNPAVVDSPDNCISCAMCAKMCPDSAISVYKE